MSGGIGAEHGRLSAEARSVRMHRDEVARGRRRPGPPRRRRAGAPRQQLLQPPLALLLAVPAPERHQRQGQPEARRAVATREQPPQGGAQVVARRQG
jgi:hypothetical protein